MWTVKVKRLGLYIESGRMSDYMSVQDIFNMYFKEDSEAEIIVKEHEFTNYDEAMNVFNTYRDVAASMYSEADNKLGGEFANIGRAILTPELSTLLPKTLSFPIHEQYNMDNERLQLISDITERHIRSITGRDYFRVFIPGNTNYSNKKYSMLNEVENSGDLGCEDITQNKANGYDI